MEEAQTVYVVGKVSANDPDLEKRLGARSDIPKVVELKVVDGELVLQFFGDQDEDDYVSVSMPVHEFMPKLAEALMGAGDEG